MRLRSRVLAATIALGSGGCAATAGTTGPTRAHPRTVTSTRPIERTTEAPSPSTDPACVGVTWESMQLSAGETRRTSSGLEVAFDGGSIDHFEDGSFDVVLSLRFVLGDEHDRWLPSGRAPPSPTRILGHCVRVTEGAEGRVVLDVAPVRPEPG